MEKEAIAEKILAQDVPNPYKQLSRLNQTNGLPLKRAKLPK